MARRSAREACQCEARAAWRAEVYLNSTVSTRQASATKQWRAYGVLRPSGGEKCGLASYGAPLVRLAEFQAGDYAEVLIDNKLREAQILERVQFRPDRDTSGWDALGAAFEFGEWRVALDSVRRLLDHVRKEVAEAGDVLAKIFAEAAEQEIFREKRRRDTSDRIALRDQPILDKYQGEYSVFPSIDVFSCLGRPVLARPRH